MQDKVQQRAKAQQEAKGSKMKFVITSGGTAGHINPSLALAEELVSRKHEVVFAGTSNRLESKLVPDAGYEFKAFEAKGFNRNKPLTIFGALASISKSTKLAKSWLISQKPDAVVGFGSYVSIPICRAAASLKIPFAIHEQNSVMGMANKYLCKRADASCLTYDKAKTKDCKNPYITGNPVRPNIFSAKKTDGRKTLNIPESANVMLVFGGSLGAAHINNALIKMLDGLLERPNLYIVHITGDKQYEDVKSKVDLDAEKSSRYQVLPYQNKMAETLAASDLCISRAGASTIAELTARKLPALLIPYPHATENHQFYNAQALLDAGCVMYLNDNAVSTPEFEKAVVKLIDNDELRDDMSDAYKKFDAENSAKKIADILENL